MEGRWWRWTAPNIKYVSGRGKGKEEKREKGREKERGRGGEEKGKRGRKRGGERLKKIIDN
jgi:hypothetical protein